MLEVGGKPSIMTYGGQWFCFEEPEQFVYTALDIGHALANICRYAGQGDWWSVGQHSLLVSYLAEPKDKFRALLHDASEAFLVDVPGPLKEMSCMQGYKVLESRVMQALHAQFGLPVDVEAERRVKEIDVMVRPAEAELIGLKWGIPNGHVTIPEEIIDMERHEVEQEFVWRVNRLMGK